jgi:N-acetylglucosaminyl-diphospho-decaprenol L-rhamnosyltransferase
VKLSYVIVTRNRRDTLLRTLSLLEQNTNLPRHQWEVLVVDNASEDGTPQALARHHREVTVIQLDENEGVPARNHALPKASGSFVVFLDDDSYPLDDAIPRSLAYLGRHSKTAALVARVILPDGSAEAPAMPAITLGGASVIRRAVLDQIGGFAPEFFRQAEEYDLSLRIWRAGYRIERFEDIRFGHDKVASGRSSALTRRMDLRNNLIVAERYLPQPMRRAYRHDWMRRYATLGLAEGHRDAINSAVREARIWARREAIVGRQSLDPATLEAVFQWDSQVRAVAAWSRAHGIKRVAIADVSKNVYATWKACGQSNLHVAAVLENGAAFAGSKYRGVPVVADIQAGDRAFDGIVLSNINPAQVDVRAGELAARFNLPLLRLWEPRMLDDGAARKRAKSVVSSDPSSGPSTPPGETRAA